MEMLLNDRYQVICTLGAGGFGETYLAEDSYMPSKRRCVVKQLRPIQNNSQIYQLVQERFGREAATLEALGGSSDQIPKLYAYFASDGQFYLVQEWIEGDTLTAKVQRDGLFSDKAVMDLMLNILPVLNYVHSKQIIHRDIKPDNIILRYSDGKPVLIDFGAVRESMGTVINSQGNTTSSIVIGTPGYMPSEQAAGRPVYSSDLYSLGVTAIYLLTGRQPHQLETDPQTAEIMWRQYVNQIHPTLAQVIERAIAYNPRDRFPTAQDMLTALQQDAAAFPPTISYSHPPAVNVPPTVAVNQYTPPTTPPTAPQNTVAVSPPASPQPATSSNSNGQRGIFVGSLIAGGLISASVMIGFALNNNQQLQSVSQSTPLPSEQATINNQPQNTTPVAPPQPAANLPSETPTVEPQTQVQADRPSPAAAIQNYYANINQGQYQTAWNQLSPRFQNNRRLHPNGYLSYIDWWGGQVDNVDVEQVNLVEASAETATVNAQLKYSMKTGKLVLSNVRFSLLWDAENSRWVVSDAR